MAFVAGVVDVTVGATVVPPHVAVWLPRSVELSIANPSHSTEGSNTLEPSVSPVQTVDFRRSVLSAVLVRPVPHSLPGSSPICPTTSMLAVPFRNTTASSPLNHPDPLVWSACARIVVFDDDCAMTYTSPAATVPVRLMVSVEAALPLKYICTL